MKSKIYFGRVRHRRFTSPVNQFSYKMFMLYIDLDELDSLFQPFIFWSKDKFNLASFHTKNYLSDEHGNIKNAVKDTIYQQHGVEHNGPIRMLTHLSYFGYCFNPVSFYYCFNQADTEIDFIVAQINNTPWDDRYCYVLDNRKPKNSTKHRKKPKLSNRNEKAVKSQFDKNFHVSPFLPMDMQYFWKFSFPGEKLDVYMKNSRLSQKEFDVHLRLNSAPITSLNLLKALLKFPVITWQVIFGIYWQSMKLWLRKAPFYENLSKQKEYEKT